MNKTNALLTLLAVALLSVALAACGGSSDSSSDTTASMSSTTAPETTPANENGEGNGGAGSTDKEAAGDQGSPGSKTSGKNDAASEKPASLKTDPKSIPKARVIPATGAVQTLLPSSSGQAEAMENSYPSIKEFGEEVTGSEATAITFALLQYLNAKANGDWATACARLYHPLQENLVQLATKSGDSGGCAAGYAKLTENAPRAPDRTAAEIDVASIRHEGERAFVIYKTPETLSADMPMYLDGGNWTVGALDAYVLTPAQLGSQG